MGEEVAQKTRGQEIIDSRREYPWGPEGTRPKVKDVRVGEWFGSMAVDRQNKEGRNHRGWQGRGDVEVRERGSNRREKMRNKWRRVVEVGRSGSMSRWTVDTRPEEKGDNIAQNSGVSQSKGDGWGRGGCKYTEG